MVATTNVKNDEAPSFSDPEDYIDEISNEALLPELMIKQPRLDKSIDRMIVIDNIPKIGQDKKEKLKQILTKLLQTYGTITNEHYPADENGQLKGYMYVEFSTEQSAQEAQAHLNGYLLDKNHTFKVNLFTDFEKYQQPPSANESETPVPYKDPGDLMWWLFLPENNLNQYDQFVVLHEENNQLVTAVFLSTPRQPTLLQSRENWTSTRFQWSPKGTYLATFHQRGIALWASKEFKQFMRFTHQDVQMIDFSPCEKYLVTFNPKLAGTDDEALILWCTRTGHKRRSFLCEPQIQINWPIFKWNFDDTYFARIVGDSLQVYETETFALLNKKPIKISRIVDFEWSPTNNYISYWVEADNTVLARVVLLEIPSKEEVRYKNLVNVSECKMYWQSNGDYVCVRVDRYKKAGKKGGCTSNLEVFRIREKQIPVDSHEIKETFQGFAWEPNGNKFAYMYTDAQNRPTVAFYRIMSGTAVNIGKLELIKEVKPKSHGQIVWSPQGQYCAIPTTAAKSQGGSCYIEFYDVTSTDVQLINRVEHDHMSDFEWDPTGRFFVTFVSNWNFKADNSYIVWNFQGKQLQKHTYSKLFKFSWRPRPASLLTDEQKREIRKNLKQFSIKYDKVDAETFTTLDRELLEKRRKFMSEFTSFKDEFVKRFAEQKRRRLELRNGIDTDKLAEEEVEFTIEFLIDSKKELVE